MKKILGFGIYGTGLVAPFHAKAIRGANGARLVGFCGRNQERREALANEYGGETFAQVEAMVACPDLDVLVVATPNHLHTDAVMAGIAAGKHVLVEKPPAMTLDETDRMLDAADRAGVRFGCFVQSRVRRAICAMKSAIDAERFGRLLRTDVSMQWWRPPEYYRSAEWRGIARYGAGVTVQQAFHYIDLMQHLAGAVTRVEARLSNVAHPDIPFEDSVTGLFEYASGATGLIQASTGLWPGTDMRIEIYGTGGTAVMSGEKMVTWKFREERPEDAEIAGYGSAAQATGAGGAADFGYLDHQTVVQDMVDAVHEGREVIIPARTVRHTLEIVLAIYQSAANGVPVTLPIKDDPSVWDRLESMNREGRGK